MKKIFFGVILFLFPFLMVNAEDIHSIDMDISIDRNGNATIIEEWDITIEEGTEGYHPYYNIGNSTIHSLNVSMDGIPFTTISDWDIDRSFSEKAYKAGFYQASSSRLDICFGISSYGSHVYTIEYVIDNFVSTVSDADIIYWNLFPYDFSAEPDNVSITIHSDFDYVDVEMYGYGKGGAVNELRDGKISIDSNGIVETSEYITVLVKFPKGTFSTSNTLDYDFSYYYDMAEEGAINYSTKPQSFLSKFLNFFIPLLSFCLPFLIIVLVAIFIDSKNPHYRFLNSSNKIGKKVNYFRDIPCNKDIFRAYWVAVQYNLITKKEDFLGTVLLKWLRKGNVRVEKIEKNGVLKKKVENNIIFLAEPTDSIELEKKLYQWMLEASIDGKLESSEFKKWCSNHYSKILKWFDDVILFETKELMDEGMITEQKVKKYKFFTYTYYDVNEKMFNEAIQMAGLKKFLKDFTLIKEREPIEVQLWDEYLMYAQIFGIADEVARQFKKLYPEIIQDMDHVGFRYDDILFIHMISYSGMRSASAAQSQSYSSSGGGGGSFGGGGGGGGFR